MNYYEVTNEDGKTVSIHCDDPVMWIPLDEANADYQRFLEWVAQGNTASRYVPPVVDESTK